MITYQKLIDKWLLNVLSVHIKFKRNVEKITLKYAANMHNYYDKIKLKEIVFKIVFV